jgi:S1-C subfamily serine protease
LPISLAEFIERKGNVEILTNFHVVEGCENITVKLPLKNVETATLIARDQKNDLAVVQIKTLPASVIDAELFEFAAVFLSDQPSALSGFRASRRR